VADVVSRHRTFSAHITTLGHAETLPILPDARAANNPTECTTLAPSLESGDVGGSGTGAAGRSCRGPGPRRNGSNWTKQRGRRRGRPARGFPAACKIVSARER
jgi:hypothetical protein